jgi:hypothetical protein
MIGIKSISGIVLSLFISMNINAQDIDFKFIDKGMKPIMNLEKNRPVVSYVFENGLAGSQLTIDQIVVYQTGWAVVKYGVFDWDITMKCPSRPIVLCLIY